MGGGGERGAFKRSFKLCIIASIAELYFNVYLMSRP